MKLQLFACYEMRSRKISPNATSVTGMRGWVIVQSKGDCDKDAGAWKFVRGIPKSLFLLGAFGAGL